MVLKNFPLRKKRLASILIVYGWNNNCYKNSKIIQLKKKFKIDWWKLSLFLGCGEEDVLAPDDFLLPPAQLEQRHRAHLHLPGA